MREILIYDDRKAIGAMWFAAFIFVFILNFVFFFILKIFLALLSIGDSYIWFFTSSIGMYLTYRTYINQRLMSVNFDDGSIVIPRIDILDRASLYSLFLPFWQFTEKSSFQASEILDLTLDKRRANADRLLKYHYTINIQLGNKMFTASFSSRGIRDQAILAIQKCVLEHTGREIRVNRMELI